MAITKSFSRKSLRSDAKRDAEAATSPVSRSGSKRLSGITKLQISAPIELISTTNMISYTSRPLRLSTSTVSVSSSSPTSSTFPPLSAASSISEIDCASPPTSPTVKPKHHPSSYFTGSPVVTPPKSPARSNSTRSISPIMPIGSSEVSAPPIPRRSVTHTTATSTSARARKSHRSPPSVSSNRGLYRTSNPFGPELAKVSEIAEEFGVSVVDAEEEYMLAHGLRKFCADDYLREIDGLFGGVYDNELPSLGPGWI